MERARKEFFCTLNKIYYFRQKLLKISNNMCDGFLTTKIYFHAHEEIKREKLFCASKSKSVAVLSIDIESH